MGKVEKIVVLSVLFVIVLILVVSLDASKHIDLRAHFLRERARDRVVLPEYVDTTTNGADGLTKSQPVSTFLRFANEVCVTAAPSTLRSD